MPTWLDTFPRVWGARSPSSTSPPEDMQDALLGAGFPTWQAEGLLEDYAHYRRNEASAVRPGVQQATRKLARPFSDFAQEYGPAFS